MHYTPGSLGGARRQTAVVWYRDDEVQGVEEFLDPAEAEDWAAELRDRMAVDRDEARRASDTVAGLDRLTHVGRSKQLVAGGDLNPRPSGYEPDELPDCSTPRHIVTRPSRCGQTVRGQADATRGRSHAASVMVVCSQPAGQGAGSRDR